MKGNKMALTKEQADKIKVDEDVIVDFSMNGGDISAEQLAKWTYRKLETWPSLLNLCKEFIFLEKTNMTKKQIQLQIDRTKQFLSESGL